MGPLQPVCWQSGLFWTWNRGPRSHVGETAIHGRQHTPACLTVGCHGFLCTGSFAWPPMHATDRGAGACASQPQRAALQKAATNKKGATSQCSQQEQRACRARPAGPCALIPRRAPLKYAPLLFISRPMCLPHHHPGCVGACQHTLGKCWQAPKQERTIGGITIPQQIRLGESSLPYLLGHPARLPCPSLSTDAADAAAATLCSSALPRLSTSAAAPPGGDSSPSAIPPSSAHV